MVTKTKIGFNSHKKTTKVQSQTTPNCAKMTTQNQNALIAALKPRLSFPARPTKEAFTPELFGPL